MDLELLEKQINDNRVNSILSTALKLFSGVIALIAALIGLKRERQNKEINKYELLFISHESTFH